MSLKLVAPMRPTEQLRAIAASGSTGLARKAQAELRERVLAELRMSGPLSAVSERQRTNNGEGSR